MSGQQLWIVGRWMGGGPSNHWEFNGVFDDEALALARCQDASWFIAPAFLNQVLPVEPIEWVGLRYPLDDGQSL